MNYGNVAPRSGSNYSELSTSPSGLPTNRSRLLYLARATGLALLVIGSGRDPRAPLEEVF